MSTPSVIPDDHEWTAADVVDRFGPIPLSRIRRDPPPGTACEQDVIDIHDHENRLCELVDGVLLEKTMGNHESFLALVFARILGNFVDEHELGFLLGADGMARLSPGLVHIPDVSFVSWDRVGQRHVPDGAMLDLAPDLAVEILSPSNTAKEMRDKLDDYFRTAVSLVWYVEPRSKTIEVFSSPSEKQTLSESDVLDRGDVLPGLQIPVKDVFAKIGKNS